MTQEHIDIQIIGMNDMMLFLIKCTIFDYWSTLWNIHDPDGNVQVIELQVCPRRDVLSRIMSKSWLTSLLSHLIILHHLSKYLLSGSPTYSRFPVLLHSNLSWSRSAQKSRIHYKLFFYDDAEKHHTSENEKNYEVVFARWYLNQTCVRNWSSLVYVTTLLKEKTENETGT